MLNREAVTSECLRIGDFQVLALALLATCRLQSWQAWLQSASASGADAEDKLVWLLEYVATST
jgi:hypothetical protein